MFPPSDNDVLPAPTPERVVLPRSSNGVCPVIDLDDPLAVKHISQMNRKRRCSQRRVEWRQQGPRE